MNEQVEARAFRGTRKKSVYRSHPLGYHHLVRIAAAGEQSGLALVAALGALPCEIEKEDAERLAAQLSELRLSGALLDLDDELTARAELARFCTRARGGAWLTVT
ncbi:MAG: hypothetical protein ACTHKS_15260 [Gaiellaceae bacterium]